MGLNGLKSEKRVSYFEYDFAKNGGDIGAISVPGQGIPKGAIINDGIIHVSDAVLSAGAATVSIGAVAAGDILAATAKASLSANALLDTIPVGTAATSIRTTANISSLIFTVAVAALTAGKIVAAIEWYPTTV